MRLQFVLTEDELKRIRSMVMSEKEIIHCEMGFVYISHVE